MAQRDAAVHDRRPVPGGEYADCESTYEGNADWLYRTIFARVGNRPDAEDLTSEVFLAAQRRPRAWSSVPEVRACPRATAAACARRTGVRHWGVKLLFLQGCSLKDCAVEPGVSITDAKVLQHRAIRLAAQAGDEDGR